MKPIPIVGHLLSDIDAAFVAFYDEAIFDVLIVGGGSSGLGLR